MSKTAEEIIHEQIGIKPGAKPITPMDHGECLRCMREFAAQEVEEYKKQLKKDCDVLFGESMAAEVIKTLIDTVK